MSRKIFAYLFLFFIGTIFGLWLKEVHFTPPTSAQESNKQPCERQLLHGHGRASTSWRAPNHTKEPFNIMTSAQSSFQAVPTNKNFVLTDVVFHPQGSVGQTITVNIATLDPTKQYTEILFQTKVGPDKSETVAFCSGYIIPSGYSLVAYTGAGYDSEQYISISVSGYLEEAKKN